MTLQKELESLLAKREAMQERHMAAYRSGSATRARTTSHNANVSNLNDRIVWLRVEIKKTAVKQCDDGYPSCRTAEATGHWCEGVCAAANRADHG